MWQIAEDYAAADLLLRLPGHCPMPAFREVEDVPLVVRRARKSRQQVLNPNIPETLKPCDNPARALPHAGLLRGGRARRSRQQVLNPKPT